MKSHLALFFSGQTPPPGSQEGLPYWTLWFFLCVILLLLAFIFLRDKDLRQRLNRFFFGAKKKLIKFRLQARLKIANRKKKELHRELGQKTWEEGFDIVGAEKIKKTLTKLDEKKGMYQKNLKETETKISKLKKSLDEITLKNGIKISGQRAEIKIQNEKLAAVKNKTKEYKAQIVQRKKVIERNSKELHVLNKKLHDVEKSSAFDSEDKIQTRDRISKKIEELSHHGQSHEQPLNELREKIAEQDDELKAVQERIHEESRKTRKAEEESKKEQDDLKKEIGDQERHMVRLQEKSEKIEKRKQPLFENLGILTDQTRINHTALALYYSQIDKTNKRIEAIKKQLQELD